MKRIDLHNHLDGSLPAKTILKLAELSHVTLPANSVEEIKQYLTVSPDCTSLNEYLEKFAIPISVLQTRECLEEAVYDLLFDLNARDVCYAEIRFAPGQHMQYGLTQHEVVESALKGLYRAERDFPIQAQLILCCMRGADENINRETIHVAKSFLNKGVCCVDLAGAEAIFPTSDYTELFAYASEQNIPFIIHAGEADGPESMWSAISMGAKRIGHGIAAVNDSKLMEYLQQNNIPLEVCVTSNVQTKGAPSVKDHPIMKMLEYGLCVTVNTDNMTVSGTDINKEFDLLKNDLELNSEQEYLLVENAIEASFLSAEKKEQLRSIIFE